ncbi:MAG: hypothetical protein ABI894_03820 [Ilumatobacteraceae bacterium]
MSAAPWRSRADRSSLADHGTGEGVMDIQISPQPTDDEVAAIVAALDALWPKPVRFDSAPAVRKPTWRFSNRWWIAPLATRRQRPRR